MFSYQIIELPNNCSTRVITNLQFVTKENLKLALAGDIPASMKKIYGDFKGFGGAIIWSGRTDQTSDIAKLEFCGFQKIYGYKSIHGGRRGMVLYALEHTKENVNVAALEDVEEDWSLEPNRMEAEEPDVFDEEDRDEV